jgi:dihydroxyacetone kinase
LPAPVDQTVAQLLEKITDKAHGYMSCLDAGGGEVAVMVNGLGATPLLVG